MNTPQSPTGRPNPPGEKTRKDHPIVLPESQYKCNKYTLTYDFVDNKLPACPECGGRTIRYGKAPRVTKGSKGERHEWIARLMCTKCHHITHVLAAHMVPHKQYIRQTIQMVLTGWKTKDARVGWIVPSTAARWLKEYDSKQKAPKRLGLAGVPKS